MKGIGMRACFPNRGSQRVVLKYEETRWQVRGVKCEVLGAKCEVQLKRWLSQAGEQLRAVLVAVRRATEGGEHH